MKKYDLAVIGAGSGGLNSGFTAAAMGKKVVMIERHQPGGECTWSGCIPSKAIIQIAKDVKAAQKFTDIDIDSTAIMNKVRALIHEANQAEAVPVLEDAGIEYLQGAAQFKDAHTLEVNGQIIEAENIIISTGSSAMVPPISGLDTIPYLTNENIFDLKILPKRLIVLGGGAIGVELSQALQRLGVQIQLVEMADHILIKEEKEFALAVQEYLSNEGVQFYTASKAIEFKQSDEAIELTIATASGHQHIIGDAVLLALGRKPNTDTLNLDDIGIQYGPRGIEVNEYNQTTVPHIYAIGDVVGPYLFSHSGGHQARSVVRNLYASNKRAVNLDSIAWCTFVEPELARCGFTEEEARQKYGNDILIFTQNYADLDRAVVDQKTFGMAKVICDSQGHILGASILGERACELLCELQVMKQHGIPLQGLQDAMHPYPGYSELLLALSLDAYSQLCMPH